MRGIDVAYPDDMPDIDIERRSVAELVAILLGAHVDRRAVVSDLRPAAALLEQLGGLPLLSTADARTIERGLERAGARRPAPSARAVAAAFELGRRASVARSRPPERLSSAEDVATWAAPRLGDLAHEELWVLALDGRSRLRAARQIARGGLHGASARVADPIRAALRVEASAFVLVHNHPSGDPTPSPEDVAFTTAIALAAEIVGVPLVDHVVVASGGFSSVPTRKASNGASSTPSLAAASPR